VIWSNHGLSHHGRIWKTAETTCIRGLRITVWDVLSWLAAGMTERGILDDYAELEPADFPAIYEFATRMGRRVAF
jgi:uncharacterized protein (DUF433 family)